MRNRSSRRVAVLASIAAVFVVVATAAFAADLSPNATSLPSKNPTDLKASNGKAWSQMLPAATYVGRDAPLLDEWGDVTTTGGGFLTIGKQTTSGFTGMITITIKSGDSGLVISNAMVTASGGQVGAVQIASTTLSKDGMTYTIKLRLPGEEGTPPTLSIKWYTQQLML